MKARCDNLGPSTVSAPPVDDRYVSRGRGRRVALALAVLAALGGCAAERPAAPETVATAAPAGPVAPAALQARLDALAAGFDGRVGLAVRDVRAGWTAAVDGGGAFPQQSVSKLWVAVAALDAVDRGALRMDDPVVVTPADLSVFHQPIRAELRNGRHDTTVEALLTAAMVQSDNAANDILIRRLGGAPAVQQTLQRKGLNDLRLGAEERHLQARIAGLEWRPEYSFGRTFWTARDALPPQTRTAAMESYLRAPPDAATPVATVTALARLQRGELLSPASTEWLLSTLETVETGPNRLKAGLPPGWRLAHKTGTGQVLGELQTGFNDVGLITAPDGRTYAVAVFIAFTRRPLPERQALMAEVSRAVATHHAGTYDPTGITSPATPGRTQTAR